MINKDILKKYYNQLVKDPMKPFGTNYQGSIAGYRHDQINRWNLAREFAIISGSFNPLHDAHRYTFKYIKHSINQFQLWEDAFFEISIRRVGKPDLTVDELYDRLGQFIGFAPVLVTNAPTYLEKITTIPFKCCFHIGCDTLKRLVDQYGPYGLSSIPTSFWVYDRSDSDGNIRTANDLFQGYMPDNVIRRETPDKPKELYSLSSTKLRSNKQILNDLVNDLTK